MCGGGLCTGFSRGGCVQAQRSNCVRCASACKRTCYAAQNEYVSRSIGTYNNQECSTCTYGKVSNLGNRNDATGCTGVEWSVNSWGECEHKCGLGYDEDGKAQLAQARTVFCRQKDGRFSLDDIKCTSNGVSNTLDITQPCSSLGDRSQQCSQRCDGVPIYLYESQCWRTCPVGTWGDSTGTVNVCSLNTECGKSYVETDPTATSDRVCGSQWAPSAPPPLSLSFLSFSLLLFFCRFSIYRKQRAHVERLSAENGCLSFYTFNCKPDFRSPSSFHHFFP
jgi:hypothetical protein